MCCVRTLLREVWDEEGRAHLAGHDQPDAGEVLTEHLTADAKARQRGVDIFHAAHLLDQAPRATIRGGRRTLTSVLSTAGCARNVVNSSAPRIHPNSGQSGGSVCTSTLSEEWGENLTIRQYDRRSATSGSDRGEALNRVLGWSSTMVCAHKAPRRRNSAFAPSPMLGAPPPPLQSTYVGPEGVVGEGLALLQPDVRRGRIGGQQSVVLPSALLNTQPLHDAATHTTHPSFRRARARPWDGIVRTLHTEWVASSTVMDEGSSSSRPSATEGTSRPRVVSRSSVLSASWRQSSRNRFFSSKISCEGTRHHDQSARSPSAPPPPVSRQSTQRCGGKGRAVPCPAGGTRRGYCRD